MGKEYASNDMGDGPCKLKGPTKGPKRRKPPLPSRSTARSSITNYFAPLQDNPVVTPPPREAPTPAWGSQHQALPPIRSNNGSHIFSTDTLAIAMAGSDIAAAHTALAAIPPNLRDDTQAISVALAALPLAIAVKHLPTDYCSIPRSGLCTPIVIDHLLHGPPEGSLLHPPSRERFLFTLQHVAACTTAHRLSEGTDAMARYRNHLLQHPATDTLRDRNKWMPADILLALLNATSISATVWMEETSLPTPFAPPWLPLSGLHDARDKCQRPQTVTAQQLLQLADSNIPHVGYTQCHHFIISEATAHFDWQVRWLLINMAAQILELDIPGYTKAPIVSSPLLRPHAIQCHREDMVLYVPQRVLKPLTEACAFVQGDQLRRKVRDFLSTCDSIQCAHRASTVTPSIIPVTGYCALHAMDHMLHGTQQSSPSPFPSLTRVQQMISQILESPHLSSLHLPPLEHLQHQFLTCKTLDARQWPHLGLVSEWANILQPTSLWLDDSSDLTAGWVRATVIPSTAAPATRPEPGVTWKLPDLLRLSRHSHLALMHCHYSPTHPNTAQMSELVEGLVDATVQFLTERLDFHHKATCPPPLCDTQSRDVHPSAPVTHKQSDPWQSATPLISTAALPVASVLSTPRKVAFCPEHTECGAPSLVSYAPAPRPLHHPALIEYNPEETPPLPTRRFPRQAHSSPRVATLPPLPAPPADDPYCTLAAQQFNPDLILIGAATAPGSYYGAYAKQDIEIDTPIGPYISRQPMIYEPVTHPSDPTTSHGDYAISIKHGDFWYEEDPFLFDSCAARFIDECLTEEDENCTFRVIDSTIWVVATKPIRRYEQMFTRYGHAYWCDSKWPMSLLQAMLAKYRPTLTSLQLVEWKGAIERRRTQDKSSACFLTTSILRPSRVWSYDPAKTSSTPPVLLVSPPNLTDPILLARSVSKERNTRRRKLKEAHKRSVIQGDVLPKRLRPGPAILPMLDPSFLPQTWSHTFSTESLDDADLPTTCRMMSWAIQGRLGATGDTVHSGIQQFLTHVAELMTQYRIGIMWLTDARFTANKLDIYLPTLRAILPNCRVIQFPTYYIKTGSRCQSFNRMGGAIAILTHEWHGYVKRTIPDPTGSGLINAIDIAVGTYQFRSLCPYFLPMSTGKGPASLYTRLKTYLSGPKCPQWAKGLTPMSYQFAYSQKLVSTARLQQMTVFTQGDMNRSPSLSISHPAAFEVWKRSNAFSDPMAAALHHLPGYHTWKSPTQTQGNTIIDHALYTALDPGMRIADVGTVHDDLTNSLSDHLPIWIAVSLSGDLSLPSPQQPIPLEPYVDLDMRKDQEREEYNVHLTHRLNSMPKRSRQTHQDGSALAHSFESGRFLGSAMSHTSLSVRASTNGLNKLARAKIIAKCRRKRGSFKQGYSREMIQIKTYIYFYKNVIRTVFPSGKIPRNRSWTEFSYTELLAQWYKAWRHEHATSLCQITKISPVSRYPDPVDLGLLPFRSITRQFLQDRINSLLKELQGERRRFLRTKSSPAFARLEEFHANKELGKIISQLACRPPDMLDLQSLPCPTRGQIIDHYTVQVVLNDYFREWHAIPASLDPAADKLARDPDWWHSLLEYRTRSSEHTASHDSTTPSNGPRQVNTEDILPLDYSSSIPLSLQDGLRRVCAVKISQPIKDCLQNVLDETITFEDFDAAINALTNGGAPGPSGVTVNMVKAWSLSTRRWIHMHMTNIWTAKTTPAWFRDKVIKLAPKITGNSELKNMRPISLYEVLRKTWTTIVAKRIHLAWHNNDVLHPAQYGYRLDNGTHMALFNVINQIEDATHNNKTKHITFWDIRRAFDAIPRNMQKLAWTRLGVPLDVAEWFVDLDDGGLSFISTPLYHRDKNLKTPEEMGFSNTHFSAAPELSFQTERGIGQGESASSLMWTALYDILLEWIDPANRHLHVAERDIHYTDEDITHTKLNAYADDLATLTGGPRAEYMQQLIATWLSAFCAFTGLVMHPAKICSTILGPVPDKFTQIRMPGPVTFAQKTDLLIHDLNWMPISCPILPHVQSYKYLGVQLDLRHESQASLEGVLNRLNGDLSHLMIQKGSPKVKIDYILFKIIPIVIATALCSNWTLKQYRELDRPFSAAYRRLLCLPDKFPTSLIYLPLTEMGIGLPRFSDKAQLMKWQSLLRCLAVGGDPELSMQGFIDRLPADASQVTDELRRLTKPARWPRRKPLIMRSLIEWFDESGLSPTVRLQSILPPEERDRTSLAISTIAEDLRLWPSDIYSDEDNANLPPIRLIATDGSFRVQPRSLADIITPERELRNHGKGAGGIVFLPPGYDETKHTPNGIRIECDHPEPGMNAFYWELVTQLIALHFAKYQPDHLVLTSDCTSAIAITNQSLRTHINRLPNARGGVLASGVHWFADPYYYRYFIYTQCHPERYKARREKPTLRDKGINMGDAMAGKTKAGLNGIPYPMYRHTLKLTDLFKEIIPVGQWHLRTNDLQAFPVMHDILEYQHLAQARMMCTTRDAHHGHSYWSSTSFGFANQVHPTQDRSYWAAARRAVQAYDWGGHGRNRAKPKTLTVEQREATAKCGLCGQLDSQSHCMLDCTHAPFTELRRNAKAKQTKIADTLLKAKPAKGIVYLIKQFCTASWNNKYFTSRIWLGLWNHDLLSLMTNRPLTSPMSNSTRSQYIKVTRKLTAPLLDCFYAMVTIIGGRQGQPAPLPSDPGHTVLTNHHRDVLEALFPQDDVMANGPITLSNLDQVSSVSAYTLSDAASYHYDADSVK